MRVLVLGASGMLGHKLYQVLMQRCETFAMVRMPVTGLSSVPLYADTAHVIGGIDAMEFRCVREVIERLRPAVIVNCIGVIKQLDDAHDMIRLVTLNALFPHRVAAAAASIGARMIQISTDCVFSGRRGDYAEPDLA